MPLEKGVSYGSFDGLEYGDHVPSEARELFDKFMTASKPSSQQAPIPPSQDGIFFPQHASRSPRGSIMSHSQQLQQPHPVSMPRPTSSARLPTSISTPTRASPASVRASPPPPHHHNSPDIDLTQDEEVNSPTGSPAVVVGDKRKRVDSGPIMPQRGRPRTVTPATTQHISTPITLKPLSSAKGARRQSVPPPAKASDADLDAPIPVELEDMTGRKWSVEETRILLEALLDVDSAYWDTYKTSPDRAFRKISSDTFNKVRSPSSVKSKFERMHRIYMGLHRLEGWTGNGGGDPDVIPDVAERIGRARNSAIDIPAEITADVYETWMSEGWYNLFNARFHENPVLKHTGNHQSGHFSESEPESELELDTGDGASPVKPKPISSPPKSQAKGKGSTIRRGVPVPAASTSKVGKAKQARDAPIAEYLSKSVSVFEARNEVLVRQESRLERESSAKMELQKRESNCKVLTDSLKALNETVANTELGLSPEEKGTIKDTIMHILADFVKSK